MKLVLLLLAAIAMIILGARGTYKAVWNSFFPNEPIVTTPVNTTTAASSTTGGGGASVPTPTTTGQAAGTAARNWINSVLTGTNAGSNTTTGPSVQAPHTSGNQSNVPSVNVPPGKQAVVSTGIPSWWPSWLPWPGNLIGWYPGEGYTGQVRNAP